MELYRHRYILKASFVTAILWAIAFGGGASPGQIPPVPSVYLTNYGSNDPGWPMTVLPFGIGSASIDLGRQTWGLAASPDGKRVYATATGSRLIAVIDTRSNTIVDRIELDRPAFALAVSPDGNRLYATTYSNLAVIDTSTKAIIANPDVGLTPLGVAATPDGNKIYVTNSNSDSLSVITTKNFKVTSTIALGPAGTAGPRVVAVSPDGSSAYIVLNGSAAAVAVLDTTTDSTVAMIPFSVPPNSVAFTPDAKRAYVTLDNTVAIIDTSNRTIIGSVAVGDQILDVAVGADGKRAWVTHPYSHWLSTIDTTTQTLTTSSVLNSNWNVVINDTRIPIDIKPGESPNSINLSSAESIPVAILSSPGFSAPNQIDPNQLYFGRTGWEFSVISCNPKGEDVNHDGLPDLVCRFNTAQTQLQPGDKVGIARALVFGDGRGTIMTGINAVTIKN
jgi:YVTN family beta-propeller protein